MFQNALVPTPGEQEMATKVFSKYSFQIDDLYAEMGEISDLINPSRFVFSEEAMRLDNFHKTSSNICVLLINLNKIYST